MVDRETEMHTRHVNRCENVRIQNCIPEIPKVDDREANVMLNDESFIEMLVVQ